MTEEYRIEEFLLIGNTVIDQTTLTKILKEKNGKEAIAINPDEFVDIEVSRDYFNLHLRSNKQFRLEAYVFPYKGAQSVLLDLRTKDESGKHFEGFPRGRALAHIAMRFFDEQNKDDPVTVLLSRWKPGTDNYIAFSEALDKNPSDDFGAVRNTWTFKNVAKPFNFLNVIGQLKRTQTPISPKPQVEVRLARQK